MPVCLMENDILHIWYQQVISEFLDFSRSVPHWFNGKFILDLCDAQVFKTKILK